MVEFLGRHHGHRAYADLGPMVQDGNRKGHYTMCANSASCCNWIWTNKLKRATECHKCGTLWPKVSGGGGGGGFVGRAAANSPPEVVSNTSKDKIKQFTEHLRELGLESEEIESLEKRCEEAAKSKKPKPTSNT